MIKSGGEWISSIDLENRLSAFPEVAEVAVIAVADERWEERPLVLVVAAKGTSPSPLAMRSALLRDLPKYCVPEYWTQLESLPRTSVGKIDKRALRAALLAGEITYVRIDEVM